MGHLQDASQISEKIGSCGDIMKIYLKVDDRNIIQDVRYEITGCAGAISAAMAVVDLIKGQPLDKALTINDGDVFKRLENIPEKNTIASSWPLKPCTRASKNTSPPIAFDSSGYFGVFQRSRCR